MGHGKPGPARDIHLLFDNVCRTTIPASYLLRDDRKECISNLQSEYRECISSSSPGTILRVLLLLYLENVHPDDLECAVPG
jgi:hypothetical protein